MVSFSALLLLALCIAAAAAPPAEPAGIDVWPGHAPGETTQDTGRLAEDQSGNVIRWTGVTRPQMRLYRAAGDGAKPAVLVCPGGGYGILAMDLEGTEVAEWLNGLGFTAAVLRYRVPDMRDGAFQDGQRALSLLRSRSTEYGIDPRRLGILGFSAGGHLSARIAARFAARSYRPVDDADRESCRPDFALLIYPAYLVDPATHLPEPEVAPAIGEPPVFLTQTEDDPYFALVDYDKALRASGVATRRVTYKAGGHGYGLRLKSGDPASHWKDEAAAWLVQQAGV